MSSNDGNGQIFREKSMEQLSTPDQLTGYLRVTGPGVWVVLLGIIVLLAGMLVWGIFGRIISTVTVPAIVKDGKVSCYVLPDAIDSEDPDIDIRIGDITMTADPKAAKTTTMTASDDPALYSSGSLAPGKNVKVLKCDTTLTDGGV